MWWPWRSAAQKLLRASEKGDTATVRALLQTKHIDANARDEDGSFALQKACRNGHWQVVELLLQANATTEATDSEGKTPLYEACLWGHERAVALLLKANANPHAATTDGRTPLHAACQYHTVQRVRSRLSSTGVATKGRTQQFRMTQQHAIVRALLAHGADPHATTKTGHTPLLTCIKSTDHAPVSEDTQQTLQALVAAGATWHAAWNNAAFWEDDALALRLCLPVWTRQHSEGVPFTEFPVEILERGEFATQTYIDTLTVSRDIVLRRKICVVGPSCAGKTSLIKSITTQQPQLEHIDDRTIGIDHFPLRFQQAQSPGEAAVTKTHEVTFWDFAGQDAYQVAHALFFSRRTLFLICLDLEAFTVASLQASIMATIAKQERQLMDEFIERTVMRWVRLILARQPDAEFVFIATKEDLLMDNSATEKLLKDALQDKLLEVQRTVDEMKNKQSELQDEMPTAKTEKDEMPTGQTADTLPPLHTSGVVFVSCTSLASTQSARKALEALVVHSQYSFEMPDAYSQALQEILRIRHAAAKTHDMSKRLTQVFAPVASLPAALHLEPAQCRTILQTLHDLGDVLWYEDLGVELFEDTVILEPLLLIDFIRQVINHDPKGSQVLAHADLKALPYWQSLRDEKQMLAMKQVLQKFHLVYPDDDGQGIMEWDSNLIVPAYWQTKTPAAWLFLGDILRIHPTTLSCEGEATRLHWEYHFEYGLPSALFDHVVVASVSPYFVFAAGPDWIVYDEQEIAACRLMVGRDPQSLHRTIHVEAVVSDAATDQQTAKLWSAFQQLCGAFLNVQREFPGLVVSSFSWDDAKRKTPLKRLARAPAPPQAVSWMPPTETWTWFQEQFLAN